MKLLKWDSNPMKCANFTLFYSSGFRKFSGRAPTPPHPLEFEPTYLLAASVLPKPAEREINTPHFRHGHRSDCFPSHRGLRRAREAWLFVHRRPRASVVSQIEATKNNNKTRYRKSFLRTQGPSRTTAYRPPPATLFPSTASTIYRPKPRFTVAPTALPGPPPLFPSLVGMLDSSISSWSARECGIRSKQRKNNIQTTKNFLRMS